MKKAWELSVLCGADVSILIFAANGKPYEFSSKELDAEIDRYLDVSGRFASPCPTRRTGSRRRSCKEAHEDGIRAVHEDGLPEAPSTA